MPILNCLSVFYELLPNCNKTVAARVKIDIVIFGQKLPKMALVRHRTTAAVFIQTTLRLPKSRSHRVFLYQSII